MLTTGLLLQVLCSLADDAWLSTCDDNSPDALVALQSLARRTRTQTPKLSLKKLRRLQSHREPHGISGLTGAAWSDYAVEVMVGDQTFPVIVDTGSSTFAVPAAPIADCESFYKGSCVGRRIEARYGSANWTGSMCHAEVSVAGLSAGAVNFAGILAHKNFLTECSSIPGGFVSRGIMGMAYPRLLAPGISESLWDSVVAMNGIPNVFSMQCCPWSGLNPGSGSMTFGGFDEQLYSAEDFLYTAITMEKWFCINVQTIFLEGFEDEQLGAAPQACSQEPVGSCIVSDCEDPFASCDENLTCRCQAAKCNHFGLCADPPSVLAQLANETITVSKGVGKSAWSFGGIWEWLKKMFGGTSKGCKGIIDTGTSSLVLPKDVFHRILSNLNQVASSWQMRSSCLSESEVMLFPDLVIRLEDLELRVPSSTYFQLDPGSKCRSLYLRSSGALNAGLGDIPDYIIGQPLLEAYYTVFDKEEKRIGFAAIKGCDA